MLNQPRFDGELRQTESFSMDHTCRSENIRVVIVDDHSLVREGLKSLMAPHADIEVCGEAASATDALIVIENTSPHVAVVDLTLNDGNGVQLIKDIGARHSSVRIVVSSMHEETVYAVRSLRAGAMAFVHKRENTDRIIEAIRSVMEDRIFVSDKVSSCLISQATRRPNSGGNTGVDALSDRELQVFEMIGNGLATRKIAERLHLSPKTVDTHRQRIREKMHLEDAAALHHFATRWVMQNR